MQQFEIGDKVRLKDPSMSHDYDLGVGTVREIWIDREFTGDDEDEIWTDEDGYPVDEYEDTGDEILEVYFPKASVSITRRSEDFELVFSITH